MRSARQLELTVPQFKNAGAVARARVCTALLRQLREAWFARADWYLWVLSYGAQDHVHDLKRADGSPAACPVRGCDAVAGRRRGAA